MLQSSIIIYTKVLEITLSLCTRKEKYRIFIIFTQMYSCRLQLNYMRKKRIVEKEEVISNKLLDERCNYAKNKNYKKELLISTEISGK